MVYNNKEIKAMVQNILGKKAFLLPIGNHHLERNLVYYVSTEDGSAFVFKLFLKKNRWNREVAALSLLTQSSVRCPKLIRFGKLSDDTEWLITDFSNGYSLNMAYPVISEGNRIKIYEDLGRELGKIHSFTQFDFFGNWDEYGRSIDNYRDYKTYFTKHVETIYKVLYNADLPHKELIKKSISRLSNSFSIIDKVSESLLCHNDYGERNAVVRKHGNDWRLEVVIDFEQCLPSDKDKDLVYICSCLSVKNDEYEKAFLRGYEEFLKLSSDYYLKKDFYLLYFGLYICSWAYKQAPEHYSEGLELLKRFS
ncbi:MAG: phosphotransferase family protein [Bacillota bacterium]